MYKPQINSKQPFDRPTGYRPVVTNYRQDYSSVRNNTWISNYQHRHSHASHATNEGAIGATAIGIGLLIMLVIGIACM